MYPYIRHLITLTLLLVAPHCFAQVYSLDECIELALTNNISLRQQRSDYATQRLQYQQSKYNLLPSLSGSVGQSFAFGRATGADNVTVSQNIANTSFGLNANLLLFDGLAMKFKIDEARANMEAYEYNTKKSELDIRMNITTMFLQVLLNKELLAVADTQRLTTQSNVEKVEMLVKQGRTAIGELYTLQSQLAKEELQKTQAENDLRLSLLDLAQAMDVEYSENFDINAPAWLTEDDELLPSNDYVYAKALQNRPELKAAQSQLQASQSALKTAKAAYSPSLTAGASVSTGYYHIFGANSDDFGTQLYDNLSSGIGLNLSIPIFDKMQTPNSINRYKIAIERQELQIELVRQTLKKQIDQSYYNAIAAQTQQYSAQKAEQSAQEAYRYAEEKYEAGRSTAYEFNDAKNNYTNAKSQYLQAKYNYLFKLKVLKYYMAEGI